MFLLALAAVTIGAGQQPQIDVRGETVALAYGSGNGIYFAQSRDRGRTFSEPVKVAQVDAKLMLGRHRGPRIALAGETIVVTAITGGNLLSWRSSDQGRSWSGPATVNSVPDAAREGLHGLAAGADGRALVTWLDLRDGAMKLYGALSADEGLHWSPDFLIYNSPDGHICECCHPSALIGPGGALYAMWRNWLGGSRDLWLAVSRDDGRTWKPAKLGDGTWPLNACPMDGGDLAFDASGKLYTVWRRDQKIYIDEPGVPEREAGTGKDPNLTATSAGIYAAWIDTSGAVVVLRPGAAQPETLAIKGAVPVLAGSVAAWEQDGQVMVTPLDGVR